MKITFAQWLEQPSWLRLLAVMFGEALMTAALIVAIWPIRMTGEQKLEMRRFEERQEQAKQAKEREKELLAISEIKVLLEVERAATQAALEAREKQLTAAPQ